jgi:hypothetical protein
MSAEDIQMFADWLIAILIVNMARGAGYSLTLSEGRKALRRAGPHAMASAGHRLAIEMARVGPSEKKQHWQTIVGPVFRGVWPLDAELQTATTTSRLVQLLLATGDAFPEAADVIIPSVRAEDDQAYSSVFSIGRAPQSFSGALRQKCLTCSLR